MPVDVHVAQPLPLRSVRGLQALNPGWPPKPWSRAWGLQADQANFADWEEQMVVDRSRGQFFKTLYQPDPKDAAKRRLRDPQVRAALCEVIGEPVKQSVKLIGEPIIGMGKNGHLGRTVPNRRVGGGAGVRGRLGGGCTHPTTTPFETTT